MPSIDLAMEPEKALEILKKKEVENDLRAEFEVTVKDRVNRFLQIGHQNIVAASHFAQASTECLLLYRDGHFIATVMMSHAINEGIIKFVADRNALKLTMPNGDFKSLDLLIEELKQAGKFSDACAEASQGIYRSFRNDVHHMNPKIAQIDFPSLAFKNIQRLALIEQEIFAFEMEKGALNPKNPAYWDAGPDGYASAFLRIRF